MKSKILYILLFVLSTFSLSCTNLNKNNQKDILYRDSFIKLEKTLVVSVCKDGQCRVFTELESTASGSVVRNQFDGSYVLTAAHVCDDSGIQRYVDTFFDSEAPELKKHMKKELIFVGKTLEGKNYDEIATITGFTTTNIGTRLGRIKQKLKSQIKNGN